MDFLKGLPDRVPAAALLLAAALLAGCDREFENPFLPDSEGYAGAAWSSDDDGDGVADSVEKYAPGCGAGPSECLKKARSNAELAKRSGLDSIRAENMSLVEGGPAAAPRLRWYPEGLAGIRYSLASDNSRVASPVDGLVRPQAAGSAQFTLTARDAAGTERTARFRVTVAPKQVRVPVRGVHVKDMEFNLLTGSGGPARPPDIAWIPADATDKGYTLVVRDPDIARVVGGSIEPLRGGETRAELHAHDGGMKAGFKVRVKILVGCGGLLDTCRGEGGKDGKHARDGKDRKGGKRE